MSGLPEPQWAHPPGGWLVLKAWREATAGLNELLMAEGFIPLDNRATYELLTSMRSYPENMPHPLVLIEWAFHTSNLAWITRQFARVTSAKPQEEYQKFWNESFRKTCEIVRGIIARTLEDYDRLPLDIAEEFAHWSFVDIAYSRGMVRPAGDEAKQPPARAEETISAIDPPASSAAVSAHAKEIDSNETPEVASTEETAAASNESAAEPSPKSADVFEEINLSDPGDDRAQGAVEAFEEDDADWECVLTSSTTILCPEEKEYMQVGDPARMDWEESRPEFGFSSQFMEVLKGVAARMPRKLVPSSPPRDDLNAPLEILDDNGRQSFSEQERRPLVTGFTGGDPLDWDTSSDDDGDAFKIEARHLEDYDKEQALTEPQCLLQEWRQYFETGANTLERWQGLLADLGQQGDFSSLTKCKKALKPLWINVGQFLSAQDKPKDVILFRSERELAFYTKHHGGMVCRVSFKDDGPSPLTHMLAKVKRHFK